MKLEDGTEIDATVKGSFAEAADAAAQNPGTYYGVVGDMQDTLDKIGALVNQKPGTVYGYILIAETEEGSIITGNVDPDALGTILVEIGIRTLINGLPEDSESREKVEGLLQDLRDA